jgi:alpha-1,2-mannosyltransferase
MDVLSGRKARISRFMAPISQRIDRRALTALVAACTLPALLQAGVMLWGVSAGRGGRALRDGVDLWAGGWLAWHGHLAWLFDPAAYHAFLASVLQGTLPYHLWSYPPAYLLFVTPFDWLPPWPATLLFDLTCFAGLGAMLRRAGKSWWFTAAVLASPACLDNLLEHQNGNLCAALMAAPLLMLARRPWQAGALIGLLSFKPQLGLVLPLYLIRRAPRAALAAALSAIALAVLALAVFGPAAYVGFWTVTRPMMSNVLITGFPREFAGGLISVFALIRPLGLHPAFIVQGVATLTAIILAACARSPACVLVLAALATPYLHIYDLTGAAIATALLVEQALATGARRGDALIAFLVWFAPALLPWAPQYAHAVPILLALLLACVWRRGGLGLCDSSPAQPGLPASSAGRSPIPARPACTGPG